MNNAHWRPRHSWGQVSTAFLLGMPSCDLPSFPPAAASSLPLFWRPLVVPLTAQAGRLDSIRYWGHEGWKPSPGSCISFRAQPDPSLHHSGSLILQTDQTVSQGLMQRERHPRTCAPQTAAIIRERGLRGMKFSAAISVTKSWRILFERRGGVLEALAEPGNPEPPYSSTYKAPGTEHLDSGGKAGREDGHPALEPSSEQPCPHREASSAQAACSWLQVAPSLQVQSSRVQPARGAREPTLRVGQGDLRQDAILPLRLEWPGVPRWRDSWKAARHAHVGPRALPSTLKATASCALASWSWPPAIC